MASEANVFPSHAFLIRSPVLETSSASQQVQCLSVNSDPIFCPRLGEPMGVQWWRSVALSFKLYQVALSVVLFSRQDDILSLAGSGGSSHCSGRRFIGYVIPVLLMLQWEHLACFRVVLVHHYQSVHIGTACHVHWDHWDPSGPRMSQL